MGVRAGPLYHLRIPWDAAKAAAAAALPVAIYVFGLEHKSICSGRAEGGISFASFLYSPRRIPCQGRDVRSLGAAIYELLALWGLWELGELWGLSGI